MTELIRVRGLNRRGVRVGTGMLTSRATRVIDLDSGANRRDLSKHSAIGQFIVVGEEDLAVATGVVVSNGTTTTYSVSVGTLLRADGTTVAVTAVSNQAITAADVTNPRIDLVTVTPAGAIVYLAGTAAATPVVPAPAAGNTVLARLAVAANAATPAGVVITDVAPRLL